MAKLARCKAVWMLDQVTPAPRVRVSVEETVISQLAWCVESGPQAGEKLRVEIPTPLTAWLVGPNPPPKLTAPTRAWPGVVSSAQNLIVMSEKVTAEVPVLTTSKFSWFWLEPQVPNSFNCRLRELVPQPVPAVGLDVGVAVTGGVGVAVEVKVLVAVEVAVEVTAGDVVFVREGVAVPVGVEVTILVAVEVGVDVEAPVGVRVTVAVDVAVAWAVAVELGEGVFVAVEVAVEVATDVAVKVGLLVAVDVLVGVPIAVDVAVEPPGVQVATARQEGGTPPDAVTRFPW